ncbi:reverse transcriptase domain-containing protein [Tanacetum coccineum]
MIMVLNDNNELILSPTVIGWRVCINYRKLNDATQKDHFPLLFIDQMLEGLSGNEYYYFLDGFLGFVQIPIAPEDQEKMTFTCPYGTFAYRRMSFGLCNAPTTFQRCMTAIFHDMVEDFIEVFMDDFSVFVNEGVRLIQHLWRHLSHRHLPPGLCSRGFTSSRMRFATWMASYMTQLMDASSCTYQAFDRTLIGSS